MNLFVIVLLLVIIVCCIILWVLPLLLAWLFKKKFNVELKVGKIGLLNFILKDVNIVKNGYSMHIEEVSFHSSFLNSEVDKPVSVVVRDVRVNKDILEGAGEGEERQPEAEGRVRTALDFRDMQLPAGVVLFAQFLSVRVINLSVMVMGRGWLWHGAVARAEAGGAGAGRGLRLRGALSELRARLLRRRPPQSTCLAELSLSLGLDLQLALPVEAPLNTEKVHCSITNCTAILNEGIYKFLQEQKSSVSAVGVPTSPPNAVPPVHLDPLFKRIAPIVPKNFSLKVCKTSITGVRDNSRTDFCSSLHSLQVNTRFSTSQPNNADEMDIQEDGVTSPRLPQIYLAFQMDQFKINSNKEKLLFLNKLKLDAKLEKEVLNLYLIVNVLNLCYNHDDVYRWWSTAFPQADLDLLPETIVKGKELGVSKAPLWLEEVCKSCVVQGCAELWSVTLGGRQGAHCATLACTGLKVKLDQLADTRGAPYTATLPRLILGMRHWSAELLVDSAWLQVGGADAPLKRHHSWGTGFFVGVALLKWGSHAHDSTKLEAMLDCLRAEWGPDIAATALLLLRCFHDYRKYTDRTVPIKAPKRNASRDISINMTLTNFNIFALADNNICLMSRIDAISVEKNISKLGLVISGFKMADVVPFKGHYICQRAEEMANMFCYIKLTRCEFDNGSVNIGLLELAEGQWSPNLHLKCLTIVKDFKLFKSEFKTFLNLGEEELPKPKNESAQSSVTIKGDVTLRLILSDKHNMLFSFDEVTLGRDHNGFSMSWTCCHLAIDDAEIFTVEGLAVERIDNSPKIREERQNAEGFVLDWNKTWGITILSFRTIFPYEHNFAEAVQDEFVTLTKWLKLIHNYKKTEFTSNSPLPSDLFIKIEDFILEMTDDPFEVKLRDNYELLEDEYKESLKRKTMLDAKVAELCKPHLFLPAGKVEELYAGLGRRNAQIYVQRSRQLAAGAAGRPLLCCRLRHTRVLALADPALHGTAHCVRHLQQLDPDGPWPEEGMEFSTLWCRWLVGWCSEWRLQLRDFPQPLLRFADLQLWGRLMGTEQKPPPRARRLTTLQQGAPWGPIQIERSMTSLKFYHDLNCEMDQFTYAFGPCWEPVIAQCNISWDRVMRGSRDPSAALAWWDKLRLLAHGRLTLCVRRLALLLHASLDPYNTTEEMELAWTDLALDWTNAKMVFKGDLSVYVRTASKYDDCRLLFLPKLRLTLKLSWMCLADPNDHHAVVQCAPDKIPEYSSNQEHDSFRAFRSEGVGVHLSFETRPSDDSDCPVLLLYGSTLRWFESLKQILSGATRPTRRGPLFHNTKPRRPQLSRHIRTARLSLALHRFQVCYWMSFAMQRGVEVCGRRVTCGAQHALLLVPARDGLRRRARATWPPLYVNCELNDAEVWLKSALHYDPDKEAIWFGQPVEKCYCLSVGKVSYGREAGGGTRGAGPEAPPTHRLVVHDLRAAWTKTNRDVAFALFDTYMKNKQLKKNLSTDALKIFRSEDSESAPLNSRVPDPSTPATPPTNTSVQSGAGQTAALLAQLVAEAEHKAVVFSDDLSESNAQPPSHAPAPDDSSICNWLIALVNAQVVLRGCETRGYVVLCAARAEVRQRLRRARCTWAGSLQSMQYYATVSARDNEQLHQNIQWVCVEEIEDKGARAISALPDVPRLVGSGHSAGGVLGSTVGPSADRADAPQLQRIVSRCTCEFYYVSYEETGGGAEAGPASSWEEPETPCDTFTLMHHDLDVCTNSLQYAMLLDVVNNLVLYVEPQRKRALERLARMRFQLQLHRVLDPRRPIQLLQNQVRGLVAQLRRLEKETYLVQRAISEGAGQQLDLQELQRQVSQCKDQLTRDGEELHAMVACYQESRYRAPATQARPAAPVKVNEICFKHAQWRLTDADGQLGIADLVLTNFQYTKNTKSDDSVEHLLELGYVRMTNLLPNEPYSKVLLPTEVGSHMPVARQRVLRLFCRERPPVGGISVKEHFEINVVPITIGLTKKFFNTMLKFCFPERDPDTIDSLEEEETAGSSLKSERGASKNKIKGKKLAKDTNFYVKIEQKDDVEKMKERAEKNKLFIYIKIPEVPVRVSYKGNKEKNLEDLCDISIVIPTLEYHNVTWTWLDLLLAMKSDSRRVILSQAIRQKLQLHRSRAPPSAAPPEEDKARMLLGPGEGKPHKKGVPVAFKFPK